MNRASQDAIDQAYEILLKSFESANAQFASQDGVYEDVEECNSAFNATIGEISRRIQSLFANRRHRRNVELPVSRLPYDVLIQIFETYLRSYGDILGLPVEKVQFVTRTYQYAVLDLALVCKPWNDLVFNTPSLWSYATLSMPITHIRNAFERSGGRLLTLYCFTNDVEVLVRRTITAEKMIEFGNLLAQVENSSRIQDAFFELPMAGFLSFRDFLSSPNPHIKNLCLKLNFLQAQPFSGDMMDYIRTFLFQGQCPRLNCLIVEWVPLHWGRLTFASLVVLRLHHVDITLPQLHALIRHCESLTQLNLKNIQPPPENPVELDSGMVETLNFPDLRDLVLDLSTVFTSAILSSVQSGPWVEILRVTIALQAELRSVLVESALTTLATIIIQVLTTPSELRPLPYGSTRLPNPADTLHITFDGSLLLLSYAENIQVQFTETIPSISTFTWLMGIVGGSGFSGPVALHFKHDALMFLDSATWGLLSNINVYSLLLEERGVGGEEEDRSDSLRALSTLYDFLKLTMERDGVIGFIWPMLRQLDISFVDLPSDSLLQVLESRFGGSTPSETPTTLGISLTCTRLDQPLLERLKQSSVVGNLVIRKRDNDQLPSNLTEDNVLIPLT